MPSIYQGCSCIWCHRYCARQPETGPPGFRPKLAAWSAPSRRRVFILVPKKHSHTAKSEVLPHSAPTPEAGVEESGELKDFVDNYLSLADKALGFVRRPGPNAHLTISTCTHCQHTIAATSLKLLAFAENLHVCPGKPTTALFEEDAA